MVGSPVGCGGHGMSEQTENPTSYFCTKCRRRLGNDPRGGKDLEDTVTPSIDGQPVLGQKILQGVKPPAGAITFTHDGCGGLVAPSEREALAP